MHALSMRLSYSIKSPRKATRNILRSRSPVTGVGNSRALFTDVSLDPVRGMGMGVYLFDPAALLINLPCILKQSELYEQPVLRRCEGSSSTTREVQTVLWALEDHRTVSVARGSGILHIYSDSPCVTHL